MSLTYKVITLTAVAVTHVEKSTLNGWHQTKIFGTEIPWITTFILPDKTVYLVITVFAYEKATLSSYEKNAVYAAFPP